MLRSARAHSASRAENALSPIGSRRKPEGSLSPAGRLAAAIRASGVPSVSLAAWLGSGTPRSGSPAQACSSRHSVTNSQRRGELHRCGNGRHRYFSATGKSGTPPGACVTGVCRPSVRRLTRSLT